LKDLLRTRKGQKKEELGIVGITINLAAKGSVGITRRGAQAAKTLTRHNFEGAT
jgi:hypothetical protein